MEIIDWLQQAWQSIPNDGMKLLLGILAFGIIGKFIEIYRED
jgi:hypothetical protein